MFDTHCHLNDDALFSRRKEVIESAIRESGLKGFLCVGYDIESSQKALQIANEFPNVYAAVGIHPENIEGLSLSDIDTIKKMASDPKVIAIGEIGLDYHWTKETKDMQKAFFEAQIKLADELSLPATIHVRDAVEDAYEILSKHPIKNNFSLHCYSGSKEMMEKFIKRFDCYFGFDGPVTFKNAVSPKENSSLCPIDRILLETDSPYLAPSPFRGKENEPKYLRYIAETIADLRGVGYEEFVDKTDNNAARLFHVEL